MKYINSSIQNNQTSYAYGGGGMTYVVRKKETKGEKNNAQTFLIGHLYNL